MNTHVKNVYTPPIGRAHYRHFHVPDEWNDHIKKIIGKDGCNFIRATRQSGCSSYLASQGYQYHRGVGPPRRPGQG